MNIGKQILELRKQRNITQEELAAELGVTAAAVSKWENGYTMPDLLMLCALADYFRVTTDELLGRSQKPKYALIVSDSPELTGQISELAQTQGLTVIESFTCYEDALGIVSGDDRIGYILVSCAQPLTKTQWNATPEHLYVIDSPSIENNQILAGFDEFFKMIRK